MRDTFVAWSPMYHMGAAECGLGTLMCGGKVIVVDGFDQEQICKIVEISREIDSNKRKSTLL